MNKIFLEDYHLLKFFVEIVQDEKPIDYIRKVFKSKGLPSDDLTINKARANYFRLYAKRKPFSQRDLERLRDELDIDIPAFKQSLEEAVIVTQKGEVNMSQRDYGFMVNSGKGVDLERVRELEEELRKLKGRYETLEKRYYACLDENKGGG